MQSNKRRHRAHPDPVSCQSCRAKKLRCNRVQPCSNCTSRNITCDFLAPPQARQISPVPLSNDSQTELLRRIERLESLVLSKNVARDNSHHATGCITITPAPTSEQSKLAFTPQKQEQDLHNLENIGTREDSLLSSLSETLTFTIRTAHQILETQQSALTAKKTEGCTTIVTFPVYSTAVLLVDNFQTRVDHVCRILHVPTIRSLMKNTYLQLSHNESILASQAALLLALFALSAFFYLPSLTSEVATTERDAVFLSRFWSRGTLDVLEHTHRNTSGTLEDVQACILMSYVTYHLDGNSARRRLLSTTALSIARDLRLHRLDADAVPSTEGNARTRDLIDREVKRRVFWHIAATDWLQSTISGPQEGMYLIHPNHVAVNLPTDCNDDDILLGVDSEQGFVPQPTNMTFYLARVRLAHLCREWTDTIPLETPELMRLPYENIVALDQRFQDFASSLPFFFQLDAGNREKSKVLETIYPWIPIMRYCIMTAVHSRRCRLHQKFLLRLSSNPRYAYSRQASLESARAVIRLYEDRSGDGDVPSMATARMGMAVHYTHLALVVMVMDLCFNRSEPDHDERKAEVNEALHMLEPARSASPLLARSLDSLHEALEKHDVHLPDARGMPIQHISPSHGLAQSDAPNPMGDVNMSASQTQFDFQNTDFHLEASFDDLWHNTVTSDMDLDSAAWDNFFSALDSRPF